MMTWQHIVMGLMRKFRVPYLMSDETKIKLWYWLSFGKKLNLDHPQTFSEKLQWLKLYDHQPLYTTLVDKYMVKEWVAYTIGSEYVIPTLGVWNSTTEIDWDTLPQRFVLKTTQGCGNSGVVVVKDKSSANRENIVSKLLKAGKKDAYRMLGEWPYKNVQNRIIAEEYMEDQYGELRDYKFFCFDGKVRAMFIATGRSKGKVCFDFYDPDFNYLDIEHGHPTTNGSVSKPASWNEMISIAEKLSAGIPHVRVDLYEVNGKPYFGEMTFYHHGGYVPFKPTKWDKIFGDWLTLPNTKKI